MKMDDKLTNVKLTYALNLIYMYIQIKYSYKTCQKEK